LVKKRCSFTDLTGNVLVVLVFQFKKTRKKKEKKVTLFNDMYFGAQKRCSSCQGSAMMNTSSFKPGTGLRGQER